MTIIQNLPLPKPHDTRRSKNPSDRHVFTQMTKFRREFVKNVNAAADSAVKQNQTHFDVLKVYKGTLAKVFPDFKIEIADLPEEAKKAGAFAQACFNFINKKFVMLLSPEDFKNLNPTDKPAIAKITKCIIHETTHNWQNNIQLKRAAILKKNLSLAGNSNENFEKLKNLTSYFERNEREMLVINLTEMKECIFRSANQADVDLSKFTSKIFLTYLHSLISMINSEKLAYKQGFLASRQIRGISLKEDLCLFSELNSSRFYTRKYNFAEKMLKELYAEHAGERLCRLAKKMFKRI